MLNDASLNPQCGQSVGMIAMHELHCVRDDMVAAERDVRQAIAEGSPGEQLHRLTTLFLAAGETRRDAIFAVLAARVAFSRMSSPAIYHRVYGEQP